MNLSYEIQQHYPELIAVMPNVFDSHALIDALRERFPEQYEAYLAEYARYGEHKEQRAHLQLSRALHNFPNLVERHGTATSMNVKGYPSRNACWRRIR